MDANGSRPFTDLSIQNVAKFLQTVVVVDDKAHLEPRPTEYENTSVPETNEGGVGGPGRPYPGLVSPPDAEDLDAKTLVDEFAKRGIACAVLRPDSKDDIITQATKVAEFADIVVLDWILDEDSGEKAIILMRKILGKESDPGRMRLIAIYTGESDLPAVAKRAAEAMSEHCGSDINRPSDFVAQKGPVRVAIFGKEYTKVPREDRELSKRIVGTSELPGRLIREFAEMTKGLLPNVAIAGLSEVRTKTHKLLTEFSYTLDPAYLGHRMLLPNPSEAEDHVLAMLAAEILSILEDGDVAKKAGINAIRSWVEEMKAEGSLRPGCLPVTSQHNDDALTDTLLRLLESGAEKTEGVNLRNWKWEKVTHAFESEDRLADCSNRQFARMMHVKTRYGCSPPSLTLGTILFSEADRCATYWICLQPRCDSVRITEPRAFPMMPLKCIKDQRSDFEIVVLHCDSWVLLRVPRRPSEIKMFTFAPNDQPTGRVMADSSRKITPIEGPSFEWVAELKDEHAQRIANDFASSFSRVGVNESEWVRRSGKKSR